MIMAYRYRQWFGRMCVSQDAGHWFDSRPGVLEESSLSNINQDNGEVIVTHSGSMDNIWNGIIEEKGSGGGGRGEGTPNWAIAMRITESYIVGKVCSILNFFSLSHLMASSLTKSAFMSLESQYPRGMWPAFLPFAGCRPNKNRNCYL